MLLRSSFALVLAIAAACSAQPSPSGSGTRALAEKAVASALTLPVGYERDVVLRTVSRNLRHAHRDLALRSAQGMAEDYERRTFEPRPDSLDEEIKRGLAGMAARQKEQEAQCGALTRLGPPEQASTRELARRDEEARACSNLDAPPGIVPPPLPPFATLMAVARSLAPGKTRAELTYMALWSTWDRQPAQAKAALAELRALLPKLEPADAAEAQGWLDDYKVELLEGNVEAAFARARAPAATNDGNLAREPAIRVSSFIVDLLRLGLVKDAVRALALLPQGPTCDAYGPGFGDLHMTALGHFDRAPMLAKFLDALPASPEFRRLCPKGLPAALEADLELQAGRPDRALAAATRVSDPSEAAGVRTRIAERLIDLDRRDEARELLLSSIERLDVQVTDRASANDRLLLVHLFAQVGETAHAERLATGFPDPGSRAIAWSVIVGELDRAKAGERWGGPELSLPD